MLTVLVVLILILVVLCGVYVIYNLATDDENQVMSYLEEVEQAYEEVIINKDIRPLLPYATIPLSLAITNKLKFEIRNHASSDFTKAKVSFELIEQNEVTTIYKRSLQFASAGAGLYSAGNSSEELWHIDNASMKLKFIEKG